MYRHTHNSVNRSISHIRIGELPLLSVSDLVISAAHANFNALDGHDVVSKRVAHGKSSNYRPAPAVGIYLLYR